MLVGKANKQADDYGADAVVNYGGEEGYYGNVEDYLLAKINSYKGTKGEDRLEALRLAINKEGGRFESTTNLNHQLMGVLLNMSKGDETARIVTRVLVPGPEGRHYVRLTMTVNGEGCSVLYDNKKGFSVAKMCREPVEIPASGTLDIKSNNAAGTGLRGSINPLYSMESDLASMASINPNGVFLYEVPLYSLGSVDTLIKRKLPTVTLSLLVKLKDVSHVMLMGISYKVNAEADVHSTKFSTRFRSEDDPVFDRSSITRREPDARVVVDDAVYAKINDHIGRLTKASSCVCKKGEDRCTCRHTEGDMRLSWTISRGEEILYSKNPTERWEVAQMGEPLIALQVLRLAAQNRGDRLIEHALSDPKITLVLLREAGRNRLIEALAALYGGIDRLPSILALATHSAGLPHEGCYDVECGPSILDEILPGHSKCAGIDPSDVEGLVAHSLSCRVQLLSAPDCKVRPSLLGYAVLAMCLPGDAAVHIKNVAKEFGMVGTTLKNAVSGALMIPGDLLYRSSRLLESTTSDMCRYLIGCERARLDPSSHSLVRMSFMPKYLVKDHGQHGLEAITYGGWLTMTVRVKCDQGKKRSHIVMYRIGDRGAKSCTIVAYVPGMHVGFSCAMGASFDSIFGVHSHARIGYGKNKRDKLFFFKNFLKSVLGSLPHSCANSDAEAAFSVTPHYPKGSSSYKACCDKLACAPGANDKHWRSVIYTSEPFKGEGMPFYPVVPVLHKLVDVADTVMDLGRDVLSAVLPIHVHSREERLYVTDVGLGKTLEMRFDPDIRHNVALENAAKHSLTKGAFRVMSHEHGGEFGSVLSLHPFTDGGKNVICVSYRGCTYVSEAYIKGLAEKIAAGKTMRIRDSINESKQKNAIAMRPWLAVDKQAQKQAPIEVGLGGALAAGALGGLAAGALVGPAYYGPRRYYYGPRYYPGPYYPGAYPYPYSY